MVIVQGLDKLLSKYSELSKLSEKIVEKTVDVGQNIATKNYTIRNEGIEKPNVTGYIKSKKTGSIVAEGSGLTFEEYGTGTIGRNSNYPKDKIPTSGIPITGGWVYNYPSKYKRISSNSGDIFWFYKKPNGDVVPTKGQPAGMQMYNTSRELNKQKKNIVSSIIDNINKGQQ
jgi:hypothetical protein